MAKTESYKYVCDLTNLLNYANRITEYAQNARALMGLPNVLKDFDQEKSIADIETISELAYQMEMALSAKVLGIINGREELACDDDEEDKEKEECND